MAGAGRPSKRRRVETDEIKHTSPSSMLLRIPLELRLQIYDYALSDVTITVAEQERNMFDSAIELDGEIEGVPSRYAPLIKNEYDPALMMVGPPTTVPYKSIMDQGAISQACASNTLAGVSMASMDSGYASAGSSMYSIASTSTTSLPLSTLAEKLSIVPAVTNMALLQVNKQIRNEMLTQMQSRTAKQTTLYATYPYGLLVLQHHYPALLKYSKHVIITGQYTSPDEASPSAASPTPPPDATQVAASKALQALTRTMYKSYRKVEPAVYYATMPTLHMRIYYPDERRYSSIWGDSTSPIVTAMQLIPSGYIETKTWRGRTANGVTMKVSPPKAEHQDDWRRAFCSVFRRAKASCLLSGRTPMRRTTRRTEDFWEESFGDADMFEALVPEEKCWSRM